MNADELENFEREQLITIMENMISEIQFLKVDNELNERFLRKSDIELLSGILSGATETEKRKTKIQFAESVLEHHQTETVAAVVSLDSNEVNQHASIAALSYGSPARAPSTASSVGTLRTDRHQTNLSFVIKSKICESEYGLERTDLEVFERNIKIQFSELLADAEEIKLTTQDILYASQMFMDFVVFKGVNPVTLEVPLERYLKFFRNYHKNGTIGIEKMRLKSFTLESNYTDKKLQLQQRMDISSILRPVDFEQLKIDIKNLTSDLEEKTTNMIGLKSINGKISIQLLDERRQLLTLEERLHGYNEKCKTYRRETDQMCEKIVKIESDIVYWTNLVEEMNEKIGCYTAPSFHNYFQLKIELRNSKKEQYGMTRKKNVAIVKLKNLRYKLGVVNARQYSN